MNSKTYLAIIFCFKVSQICAQDFPEGHFYFPAYEKGKYGYINSTGQWVINPKFEWCYFFYEAIAGAKEKGKYGFINTKGEWIAKPIYDSVKHFSQGFAAVGRINEEGRMNWDYIDSAGIYLNLKVPALNQVSSFQNGRSIAGEDGFLNFFFFNLKGESVFEAKDFYLDENRIAEYSENLLHVYTGEGLSTYIDTTGKIWSYGNFEFSGDFKNNRAVFQSNTKFGFINKTGQEIIAPEYDSAGNFSEGIALVKLKMKFDPMLMRMTGGLVAYIDTAGKNIVPPLYSDGTAFSDGMAMVKYNGKCGFINTDGKVVIDFKYETGTNFFRGLAFVKNDNHWEYINTKGKTVF